MCGIVVGEDMWDDAARDDGEGGVLEVCGVYDSIGSCIGVHADIEIVFIFDIS